ncbi:sugar isomerase [Vallitalea longa]|uniref:Sugar isomerase n=1 Tax=Vallitalea longa TaxID=2936439 RepID=A0A9W6DCX8_9FIRM|nr:MurR/RpiR family transcriptional regulator [Vallitalea longa]GKX27631.1 sugar isomerase [Vallitalea longa]
MRGILEKTVKEVISENYGCIFSAEKKVADFILKNPEKVVNMNVSELAKSSGVSDATVVRMCHHIGYKGYYQFRIMLARDMGRKQKNSVQLPEETDDVVGVFKNYADTIMAIGHNINQEDILSCVDLIKKCKQVHIIAAGNTSPLAQYMGFRLGRLGVKCTYNIAPEYFMNHVNLADKGDIIIALSQSGTSKSVVQGMELAVEKGLKIIAITGYSQSPVADKADYTLISNGKEEIFNCYKNYAHLNETAVIDALLELVTNQETIAKKHADKPEIILSETKY